MGIVDVIEVITPLISGVMGKVIPGTSMSWLGLCVFAFTIYVIGIMLDGIWG